MSLKDRISSWRQGESEASRKRDRKRRQRAREEAAAAEQKALAKKPAAGPTTSERPSSAKAATGARKAAAGGRRTEPGKGDDERARRAGGRRRTAGGDARKLGAGVASVGVELAKLGREMLVIPLQLWLAAAEVVGRGVLVVWLRAVLPALRALRRLSARCLHFAERHVTPARAVAATVLVAIAALGASQWLDYRSVTVGSDAYSGTVGIVAPAPEVSTDIAGHAHSWAMLPLAAVALVALVLALTGRRRAGFLLAGVGIAVIAISIAVDAPKGLDEGQAAVAYEGASASLLEGFWAQIAAGTVLIACGVLLPLYLRPVPAGARSSQPTGPTPAAVIASRAKDVLGRVRVPRPKLGRSARPKRKEPAKGKVQGAGT